MLALVELGGVLMVALHLVAIVNDIPLERLASENSCQEPACANTES